MSQIIYNGIELSIVKTRSIVRTPRFSDDGTEYMWTDFSVDVSCIYNPGATSYTTSGISQRGNLPMITDQGIRFYLLQPRRPFSFAEGGIPFIQIPSNVIGGGAIDCENGPHPTHCTVEQIKSSRLFIVSFGIRFSINECPSGSFVSAIASSRYSRTEDIDNRYISTLVTSGITKFRSDVLSSIATNADDFRGYIIPQQLAGYKRDKIEVMLSSDGITMQWQTVDRQQFVDLGDNNTPGTAAACGIVEMSLDYEVAATNGGPQGIAGFGSVATASASSQGAPTANTWDMLQFLVKCCFQKLGNTVNNGFMAGAGIKENVFNNSISCYFSYYLVTDDDSALQDAGVPVRGFIGVPILSLPQGDGLNPQPPFSKGTRGTNAYELAVNYFATACYTPVSSVGVDSTALNSPGDLYTAATPYGSPQVVFYESQTSDIPTTYRKKQKQNSRSPGNPDKTMYPRYDLKEKRTKSKGIINVPIATPANSSSSSSSGSEGNSSSGSSGSSSSSSDQPTSINIQVFQPTSAKIVEFSIDRIGCVPEVPNPIPPDGVDLTLLDSQITNLGPELMPDGYTLIYRINGMYAYSLEQAIDDNGVLAMPIPAWVGIDSDENTQIIESDYVDGIINNEEST